MSPLLAARRVLHGHGLLSVALLAASLGATSSSAARSERLALRHVALDLPGAPSAVIPADVDGDGRQDLVIVVAHTEIEEIGEDRIEDMVQIATVIPALFDRRELRVYRAAADGGYSMLGEPLPLPTSVLHLEPGPAGHALVALTDDGLAELRYEGNHLVLEPLIDDPPVLAHSGSFQPSLRLVHDLDGDGLADVLLPSSRGLTVYRGTPAGLERQAAGRIPWSGEPRLASERTSHWYPQPEVRDVDGDGLPDLVFRAGLDGEDGMHVMLGTGGGAFGPLRRTPRDCHDELTDLRVKAAAGRYPWPRALTDLRDIDGDGRAEAIVSIDLDRGDGLRRELKDAKKPIQQYRFFELGPELDIEPEPYFEMKVIGHTMDPSVELEDDPLPFRLEQFADLDGDGREDLVSVTLDFSVFQVIKILATKRVGIGLDFHVYHQLDDGTFAEVPGLDLSEKLTLDLNNLKLGRIAQFAGDFDGDGRQDFVHLGRGKVITLHRGQPGCRFPKEPDLAIELDEEPPTLDLVKIDDLDGDGRSDLRITRPLPVDDPDVSSPVRLDLYLSAEIGP